MNESGKFVDGDEVRTLVPVEPAATSFGEMVVVDDSPQWMAWEGARRAWLDSKRRKSGSENTVRTYQVAFVQFFEWASVPPWQVSSVVAQEWASHLEEEGLSEASVALKLAAMSSFYDFVQRRYSIMSPDGREITLWPADQRNPFDAVQRPQISPYGRAKYPTVEEAKEILNSINTDCLMGKRDFALLFTFLVTCRRSSEILSMKWGDLQEMGDGHYAFRYRYKGGKDRRAVLNRRCYQAICAYLREDGRPPEEMEAEDYIFVPMYPERIQRLNPEREVDPNQPISNSMANRILKKYARRCEVDEEKAHLHGLRHVGARLRVELMKAGGSGVDIMEVKDLLGHSNIAVTQIYSETVLEDPEDPGGDAAAEALLPKGARRRRKESPGEQMELL